MDGQYTLVASHKDPASLTMAQCLIDDIGFSKDEKDEISLTNKSQELSSLNCPQKFARMSHNHNKTSNYANFESYTFKNLKLYLSHDRTLLHMDNLDDLYPESDAFVFLSKHSSESERPTLTCHFTGNFSDSNPFGGFPREIGITYPYLQKSYIQDITSRKSFVSEYDIIIEATHHGPTSLKKPCIFVEIGSTQKQWADRRAAAAVCQSVVTILTRENEGKHCKSVGIAFGGTHYPTRLNKLLLESEFGLASIAAKHNLISIDELMIRQMISRSVEKVTHAIVDKKGMGKEKKRILELIEKENLKLLQV
jgi:D-aminoacyl-tRNA deacylase